MTTSPFVLVKRLETDVIRLLSNIDIAQLSPQEQQELMQLKNGLIDARLEIQDYELAETRDFQLQNAKRSKEYLRNVEKLVVGNSLNAFGSVDVAHISAYIGQIDDKLR